MMGVDPDGMVPVSAVLCRASFVDDGVYQSLSVAAVKRGSMVRGVSMVGFHAHRGRLTRDCMFDVYPSSDLAGFRRPVMERQAVVDIYHMGDLEGGLLVETGRLFFQGRDRSRRGLGVRRGVCFGRWPVFLMHALTFGTVIMPTISFSFAVVAVVVEDTGSGGGAPVFPVPVPVEVEVPHSFSEC